MRLITLLLLAALLGACGFKGPLVMPNPASQAQPATPAPPARVPDKPNPSDR